MEDLKVNNHRFAGVKFRATKKMGGVITPRVIVMHYTAGWTTAGDVATLSTAARKASAHLVLSREGEITQIVPFNRRAWHAGPSKFLNLTDLNSHSIGIEISNAGWIRKLSNGNYEDQYGNTITPEGKFVGKSRTTFTPPSGWVHEYHKRLGRGDYAWEPYYPAQLEALDEIVEALVRAYPSIKYIVSHEEIDTRKWKTDPGPRFPMARYQRMLEDRDGDGKPDLIADEPKPTPKAPTPTPAPKVSADKSWWRFW